MAKLKHQLPSRDEASPSTPAVVLSSRDAKLQESLRQRIDKLPRAAKGRPGQEPKRLWTADPGLQDEVVDFYVQQRIKRTRAEIGAALGVNATMLTRLLSERQEPPAPSADAERPTASIEARSQRPAKSTALIAPAMQLTAPALEDARTPQESLAFQHSRVADFVPFTKTGMTYFIAENEVVRHAVAGMTVQDVIQIIDHLISRRIITPVG